MKHIFVINLEHRTDRLGKAKEQLDKNGLEWTRFDAIKYDPDVHDYKDEFNNFKKSKKQSGLSQSYIDRGYLEGCFGCILSHYNVIKLAKERGYDAVTILEDDFQFKPEWNEKLAKCLDDLKDRNWDMLYLSGNNIESAIPITDNIGKTVKCFTTGAYIMRSTIYDYVLDNLLNYGQEIDVFYTETVQKKFNVYTPKKNIIRQAPSYSDIQKLQANYDF